MAQHVCPLANCIKEPLAFPLVHRLGFRTLTSVFRAALAHQTLKIYIRLIPSASVRAQRIQLFHPRTAATQRVCSG